MTEKPKKPWDAMDYIGFGVMFYVVAGIAAGFLWADSQTAAIITGAVIGTVAQMLLLIGIIARGVEVGNRGPK